MTETLPSPRRRRASASAADSPPGAAGESAGLSADPSCSGARHIVAHAGLGCQFGGPAPAVRPLPVRDVAWRIPARAEIFPVAPEQSCPACGSDEWSWLLLLLEAPEWVQSRGWFANWSIALCGECHLGVATGRGRRPAGEVSCSTTRTCSLAGRTSTRSARWCRRWQSEPPMPRSDVPVGRLLRRVRSQRSKVVAPEPAAGITL